MHFEGAGYEKQLIVIYLCGRNQVWPCQLLWIELLDVDVTLWVLVILTFVELLSVWKRCVPFLILESVVSHARVC